MANEKKKIFIVDDDEMHLVTAELFLKDEYEIHKMKSGEAALEYMINNEFVPDVMLLDILMPDMDGWELLKKVKKIELLKDVPVIFLTGIMGETEKKQAYTKGVADYITKPLNMVELRQRINKVIDGHRMKVR